jgi:hypothetical protein
MEELKGVEKKIELKEFVMEILLIGWRRKRKNFYKPPKSIKNQSKI